VEDIICTPFFSISFNRNFQGLTYFSFSLIGWIKGLFTFKDVVDNNDEFISNRNNGIPLHIGVLTEFVFVILFKCRRESPAGIGSIVERSPQIWGTSPGYGASPSYRGSRFLDRGVDTCINLSFLNRTKPVNVCDLSYYRCSTNSTYPGYRFKKFYLLNPLNPQSYNKFHR